MSSPQLLSPASVEELDQMLAKHPGTPLLAGATDLMPLWRRGVELPEKIINLQKLRSELDRITEEDRGVIIGAMTNMAGLVSHPLLQENYSLLVEAAANIGARQIQQMATLGGNLANASPSADTVPPLLVYEAVLVLRSAAGTRELPLRSFYLDYKQMALLPGEWIRAIRLPESPSCLSFYRKTGARQAQAIAKLSMALLIGQTENELFRVAAGAMSPYPKRLSAVEDYVIQRMGDGEAICEEEIRNILGTDLKPIDDVRSTAEYRLKVAGNILCDMIKEAGLELD
jgi:CO/xanthine dehydrogenase FAD-binding subunit